MFLDYRGGTSLPFFKIAAGGGIETGRQQKTRRTRTQARSRPRREQPSVETRASMEVRAVHAQAVSVTAQLHGASVGLDVSLGQGDPFSAGQ